MKTKRLLITGANGFIGKNCLELLKSKDYEIHAVSAKEIDNRDKSIIFHQENLLDISIINDLMLKIRPTHLLHLAWETTPGLYWQSLKNLDWVQTGIELLKSFKIVNGKRVVMAGSCAEYDWKYGICSEEFTPLHPNSLYGTAKNSLQKILMDFSRETKISAAWGRIFYVYGPFENELRMIPYLINSLILNKETNCSHGNQIRDFIHVNDVASALIKLLEIDKNIIVNIGTGQPVKLIEIFNKIAEKLNGKTLLKIGSVPNTNDESLIVLADIKKLKSELNFEPSYSLDKGLEMTIKWWKDKKK